MALIKKPVTGMRDILPEEMELRNYVTNVLRETYASFGYTPIETPAVEHIENLLSKQGGDNEKLIFKILKRGEKLHLEEATKEEEVVDSGLRYDLTLPLARFYANHMNELPAPFKALQMGPVWRADRPQRGRFRQFWQYDIDILGEASTIAEMDLILATTTFLGKLDFRGFTIRISDRRFLKAMAAYAGFPEDKTDQVFVTLDKMDKIGWEGVTEEWRSCGFDETAIARMAELMPEASGQEAQPDGQGDDATAAALTRLRDMAAKMEDVLPEDCVKDLTTIIETTSKAGVADYRVVFDPTLVRGMGYYTGTIFEIDMDGFGGSVGGGGRYDEMIGRFTGQSAPACGFSIGFERIIMLLMEQGYRIPTKKEKTAFLIDKKASAGVVAEVMQEAMRRREAGEEILVVEMKKNKKFQKEQLEAQGFTNMEEFYAR